MLSFRNISTLWIGLALVGLAPAGSAALAGEKEAAIAKLLDVGWAATPQARAAADAQVEEVGRLAATDPRAIEASWLVLMQQRRYDEANHRVDQHLAKAPNDLTALRAKTWLLILTKNYQAGMVTA